MEAVGALTPLRFDVWCARRMEAGDGRRAGRPDRRDTSVQRHVLAAVAGAVLRGGAGVRPGEGELYVETTRLRQQYEQ